MTDVPIEVHPATPDRWDDLVDLFERRGPRGGTPPTDGCWCMWWRQRTGDGAKNKLALKGLVEAEREPGLLAYESGVPVGWVSVGPRPEFGQLMRSRAYGPKEDQKAPDIFTIVCFYIHPAAKRRGVAGALLDAAIKYAVGRGARTIEAYVLEGGDFMGRREAYETRGFTEVRTAGKRAILQYAAE
ncbi:MAG: GNAT family N-acetyltransferase [Acidimicrobiia bacterium]